MITDLYLGESKRLSRRLKYRKGVGRVSAGCRKGVELWSKLRQKCTTVARLRQNVDTCDTLAIPLRGVGCRRINLMYQRL